MELPAKDEYRQRIVSAVQQALHDGGVNLGTANILIEYVAESRIFEVTVTIAGDAFLWTCRIEEARFDRALSASIAQLRAWL